MIKFAICDDEPMMVQEISNQLSQYMNGEHITSYCINSFSDGRSLLESSCDFDVIFLDVKKLHHLYPDHHRKFPVKFTLYI